MTYKYLYLDDETMPSMASFKRVVEGDTGEISISPEHPRVLDELVRELTRTLRAKSLKETLTSYNGIILDWRLDDKPDAPDTHSVHFRAGALAQELRTRSTSGDIKDVPIVLWSTVRKLKESFDKDNTSHDLFDLMHLKPSIGETADRIRTELIALAAGYEQISQARNTPRASFRTIIAVNEQEFALLDPRFGFRFDNIKSNPTHEIARFLLKQAIFRPGPLIDETLLAARLGIDPSKEASPGWEQLLAKLSSEAEYHGPFRHAWPRWWSAVVDELWWPSLAKKSPPRGLLGASDRVAFISQATGIQGLSPAVPIRPEYSDRFETICEATRKPLDPLDGVLLDDLDPRPWQAPRYLSLNAALFREGEDRGLRPHALERARLHQLRKSAMRVT
jgi:hypothetical protein